MLCISCVFQKSLKLAFARVELLPITAGYGFELHEVVYKYNLLLREEQPTSEPRRKIDAEKDMVLSGYHFII